MSVLTSEQRTTLLARLVTYEALLEDAMDAYALGVASTNKSYKFDSTEGMQAVTKRTLAEQQKAIDFIERTIDHIERRLRGALNVNLNVRRKHGTGLRRRGLENI